MSVTFEATASVGSVEPSEGDPPSVTGGSREFVALDDSSCRAPIRFKGGDGVLRLCGKDKVSCNRNNHRGLTEADRGTPGVYRAIAPITSRSPADGDPQRPINVEEYEEIMEQRRQGAVEAARLVSATPAKRSMEEALRSIGLGGVEEAKTPFVVPIAQVDGSEEDEPLEEGGFEEYASLLRREADLKQSLREQELANEIALKEDEYQQNLQKQALDHAEQMRRLQIHKNVAEHQFRAHQEDTLSRQARQESEMGKQMARLSISFSISIST
jgi:hypothetical protein